MKFNIYYLHSIIVIIISFIAILLKSQTLSFDLSRDTENYYQFHKYLCYGGDYPVWSKSYEFYYNIFSFFYCAVSYEDFVIKSFYSYFFIFIIFIFLFLKKFGLIDTIIFIIFFFIALNPNHAVAQLRQMSSILIFTSAIFFIRNHKKKFYALFLLSFIIHNNTTIFLLITYIILNLKKLLNFFSKNIYRNFFFFLIFILFFFALLHDFIIYIIINGVYHFFNHIFYEDFNFNFLKYLIFVQLFTFSYIFLLKIRSEIIKFMALYSSIVFAFIIINIMTGFGSNMLIFRLLYIVKYIFVPICFVYFFRKIVGKKCSI